MSICFTLKFLAIFIEIIAIIQRDRSENNQDRDKCVKLMIIKGEEKLQIFRKELDWDVSVFKWVKYERSAYVNM